MIVFYKIKISVFESNPLLPSFKNDEMFFQ